MDSFFRMQITARPRFSFTYQDHGKEFVCRAILPFGPPLQRSFFLNVTCKSKIFTLYPRLRSKEKDKFINLNFVLFCFFSCSKRSQMCNKGSGCCRRSHKFSDHMSCFIQSEASSRVAAAQWSKDSATARTSQFSNY